MSASVTYIYRGSLFDDGFSRKDGNQRVACWSLFPSLREKENGGKTFYWYGRSLFLMIVENDEAFYDVEFGKIFLCCFWSYNGISEKVTMLADFSRK